MLLFCASQLQNTLTKKNSLRKSLVRIEVQATFPKEEHSKALQAVPSRVGFFSPPAEVSALLSSARGTPHLSSSWGGTEPLRSGRSGEMWQGVCSTAEAQVGSRAVRGVLAAGSTAVPVAVRLMAHIGSTLLHSVCPGQGPFRVVNFIC